MATKKTGRIKQEDFKLAELRKYDERSIRKEYSAQRSIIMKRLKRQQSAGLITQKRLSQYEQSFPKLKDLPDIRDVKVTLVSVGRFLQSESATMETRRKMAMRKELEWEYKGISWARGNYSLILRFLEDIRAEEQEERANGSPEWIDFLSGLSKPLPLDELKKRYWKWLGVRDTWLNLRKYGD